MALSQPRTIYGIHGATLYNRTTYLPYGTLQVLNGSSISLTGEIVKLNGGSSPYAWAAEDGLSEAQLVIKTSQIENFMFQVLLGIAPTEVLADAGNVKALENVNGTTALSATIGCASVGVKSGSETDLKFGKYVVKVVGATTVDVYGLSSVDFLRGADKVFEDDTLKITASPLTITTGAAVEVPGFGVELTGGSGTIGMTIGDTAIFDINPPSDKQMNAIIGAVGSCIPNFGAIVSAQKQGSGDMWIFDCYNVKALGMAFGMEAKAFGESEITGELIFDSAKNGIMEARQLDPSAGC